MERLNAELNGTTPSEVDSGHFLTASPSRAETRRRHQNSFFDSLIIGVDYMHANDGDMPTIDDLNALYSAGYLNHSPAGMWEVFEDEHDYRVHLEVEFNDSLARIHSDRAQLAAEAGRRIDLGEVSTFILAALDRIKSPELLAMIASGTKITKGNNAAIFNGDLIDEKELARRYARFVISETMLPDIDIASKTGLALGVNLNTGRLHTSSLPSELAKRSRVFDRRDVELCAHDLGLFDQAFPEVRERYLNDMKMIAKTKSTRVKTRPVDVPGILGITEQSINSTEQAAA